ncbi:hypothetical protein BDW74DRAFT_178042 [Aspergillus multicolor]|uniref:uncharacterized protein n=1 Tax=Aspergillus multicolor TaxID=41759 RepID=UPI003CCDC594
MNSKYSNSDLFERLNFDSADLILRNLSGEDLARCQLVNKKWKHMVRIWIATTGFHPNFPIEYKEFMQKVSETPGRDEAWEKFSCECALEKGMVDRWRIGEPVWATCHICTAYARSGNYHASTAGGSYPIAEYMFSYATEKELLRARAVVPVPDALDQDNGQDKKLTLTGARALVCWRAGNDCTAFAGKESALITSGRPRSHHDTERPACYWYNAQPAQPATHVEIRFMDGSTGKLVQAIVIHTGARASHLAPQIRMSPLRTEIAFALLIYRLHQPDYYQNPEGTPPRIVQVNKFEFDKSTGLFMPRCADLLDLRILNLRPRGQWGEDSWDIDVFRNFIVQIRGRCWYQLLMYPIQRLFRPATWIDTTTNTCHNVRLVAYLSHAWGMDVQGPEDLLESHGHDLQTISIRGNPSFMKTRSQRPDLLWWTAHHRIEFGSPVHYTRGQDPRNCLHEHNWS